MASTRKGPIKTMVRKLPTVAEATIDAAVREVRPSVLRAVAADTGGDRRLSGLRNGKAMTVTVKKRTLGNLVEADITGGPGRQRAPWYWLQSGTQAGARHRRRPRSTTYRHPGTPAKRTWSRGVDPALPKITKTFVRNVRKALD